MRGGGPGIEPHAGREVREIGQLGRVPLGLASGQALAERGVWAFTIGTAALDGKLVSDAPLEGQLGYILDAASGVRS